MSKHHKWSILKFLRGEKDLCTWKARKKKHYLHVTQIYLPTFSFWWCFLKPENLWGGEYLGLWLVKTSKDGKTQLFQLIPAFKRSPKTQKLSWWHLVDTFRYPKKNARRGNSFLQSIIFRFHSVNFRVSLTLLVFPPSSAPTRLFRANAESSSFWACRKAHETRWNWSVMSMWGSPEPSFFVCRSILCWSLGEISWNCLVQRRLFVPFPACHFWTTVTLRNAAPRAIRNSWPRWKHAEFFLSQSGQRKSSIQKDYIPRRLTAGGPQNDELKKVDSGTKIWPFLVFILDFRGVQPVLHLQVLF